MPARVRFFSLCLGPVVYVGIAAIGATSGGATAIAATVLLPFVLYVVFRFTEPPGLGEDVIGVAPRLAFRLVAVGAAMHVASRTAGPGRAGFDAASALGVGLATVAALYGLARVPEGRGLLRSNQASKRLDAAAAMTLLAGIATTVPAAAALAPTRRAALDPLALDYAAATEGGAALLLLFASAARFRLARRLELGVADRASAALTTAATALAVAIPAAIMGFAAPDRVLPTAALIAAAGVTLPVVVADASMVGRALRTLLVVSIVGAPIALVAAGVAAAAPSKAGATVLLTSLLLVVVGVLGERVAARLRPDAARWLSAIEKSQAAAALPEPTQALRATLATLRDRLGPSAPSPILFRLEHGDRLTVDRAGYLHEEPGLSPPDMPNLCESEPEHTFRLEVARALEVRSPHVRPALAWMEAHSLAAVTTLRDDDGAVGLLALPRAGRRTPLTLEEAQALSALTERLGSVFALSSALTRARERQLAAEGRATRAEEEASAVRIERRQEGERWSIAAGRLARRGPAPRYSPAARLAWDELAEAARVDRPVVLLCPPGVDAEGLAATVHLESDRRTAPLIVVDGADRREHPLGAWTDPVLSPIPLSRGGTLLVLDVASLPREVQALIARFARKQPIRDGADVADARLVVTVRETVDALVARGRLTEELGDALGDRAIPVPPLSARAEDVRPLALDHLARTGLALRGEALGLADDALEALLEHPFPGNDLELSALLLRAARVTSGPAVTRADLLRAGLTEPSPAPSRAAGTRRR